MRCFLLVTLISGALVVLGCGGGSAKHDGAPAAGTGGSQASGTGGALGSGTGGSTASGSDAAVDAGSCPSASTFTPCGGNVTGTWHLKFDECAFSSSSSSCGMSISISPASTYGVAYTFNANGTLSASIGGNYIGTIRYPPACLGSDAGAVQACADLSNSLQNVAQQAGDAGTDNITSMTFNCATDVSGTCICNENVAYSSRVITGTYTTSGTKITITALTGTGLPDAGVGDAGANQSTDYCVSGNTLTLAPDSSSSSDKPVVLTK